VCGRLCSGLSLLVELHPKPGGSLSHGGAQCLGGALGSRCHASHRVTVSACCCLCAQAEAARDAAAEEAAKAAAAAEAAAREAGVKEALGRLVEVLYCGAVSVGGPLNICEPCQGGRAIQAFTSFWGIPAMPSPLLVLGY
jgi:hypothetical protein